MPNNIERDIGTLLAQVRGIEKILARQDESRARLHERVDELKSDVSNLKGAVREMQDDLAEAKKVTDEVQKWKAAGMGALGVVGLGGTALGVAISGMVERLLNALSGTP